MQAPPRLPPRMNIIGEESQNGIQSEDTEISSLKKIKKFKYVKNMST